MVSRPHRRRAAKGERLCEWRKRALPRCQRIERPRSRISWPLGRRGLGRAFRQPSRDADAIKHAELRAATLYNDSAGTVALVASEVRQDAHPNLKGFQLQWGQ